ncbi:hypothetical protein ACFL13_00400 [Patescibacteria group bacterium]
MKEGTLPRALNVIGAILAFVSAILAGLFRFPECFLPGVTFAVAVAAISVFEVVNQHPPIFGYFKRAFVFGVFGDT